MKAIRATLTTSQPVISEEEFGTMFYKIPELHALHQTFLDGLRKKTEKWDTKTTIGEQFKVRIIRVLHKTSKSWKIVTLRLVTDYGQ